MQNFGSLTLWYLVRLLAILVYFLPMIIASRFRHPRQLAISYLNILLGWTVVGWVIILRWALEAYKRSGFPKRS